MAHEIKATRSKKKSGFSLIEVVLALIVFAIGLAGIMNMMPAMSKASSRAMQMTQEAMLVNLAVSEIESYLQQQGLGYDIRQLDDDINGGNSAVADGLLPDAGYQYRIFDPDNPTEEQADPQGVALPDSVGGVTSTSLFRIGLRVQTTSRRGVSRDYVLYIRQ